MTGLLHWLVHGGNVLLKPLRGSDRAKLAAIGHDDGRCGAALRSDAINVADPGAVVHVCTQEPIQITLLAVVTPFASESAQRGVAGCRWCW